jgi:hypothetical protein
MERERYLARTIVADALASRKVAFVSGPRQVGKTTLARSLLRDPQNYFLFDDEGFRRRWTGSPEESIAGRGPGPVVFDEIHKDRRWKRKLKGIYDKLGAEMEIVVTGSARLDHYRKGSDSLLGRHLPYRLHPFTVAETPDPPSPDRMEETSRRSFPWEDLLRVGGFPEPLLRGQEQWAQRWSRLRLDRIVLEDSRDFLNISDLNAFRTLADLLPERVGSLLSVNSLREDLGKAYSTVRTWLAVLDVLYFCFTIRPYARRISRALRAEPKLYLYDILRIPRELPSKRQENLAALHLLKACHFWTDSAQGEFDLRYVRTKEKREVDFLVVRDGRPWMLVECKSGRKDPSRDLLYFSEILSPEHRFQLVSDGGFDRFFAGPQVRVMGYEKFFAGLL